MAATLKLFISNGGTDDNPTDTDIDASGPPQVRFKQADNATIDAADPMPIPAAGTNYSRWKNNFLKCTVAPDTQADTFKIYTDGGGFGTGIATRIGNQFPTKNSGASTGYDVADVNDDFNSTDNPTTGNTGITSDSDLFSYTSGSPLTGPSISEAGSIINAINETTNYFITQMEVINTAVSGNLADETITIQWAEI